jgi:hypothetical protein
MPEQQTVTGVRPRSSYGIGELARFLDVDRRRLDHALTAEIVPAPDRYSPHQRRWTHACAVRLLRAVPEIRACLPPAPGLEHLGAVRSAELLAARLGHDVPAHVLPELALLGHVPRAGTYKGHALYDRRAVDQVDPDLVTVAAATGRLVMADEAAQYLVIRASDLDHLLRAGRLIPAIKVRSSYQPRREAPAVPLFRIGDLDTLARDDTIDWSAVRDTPRGQRSPLAALPTGGRR